MKGGVILTKTEVTKQYLKIVMCELCDKTFSCQQNPDEHPKNVHGGNHKHSCTVCLKV